jgi:hypothetical protein
MTTDPDRTAYLEFTAAAFVTYALRKEPTMTTTRDDRSRDAEMLAGHRAEDMTNGGIEPAWCPCGAPIPDEGDCCHDCAQESAPEDIKAMKPYRALIALAALALSLTTHTAHAAPDCPITGTSGEGFPVATCADGTTWMQDMDGQIYENAAGYPVYAPGTWVPCTYC